MRSFVTRTKNILITLLRAITALTMFAVFGIILANALWRYGAGKSLVWGEELAIYGMIFGVMFGICLACLEDRHVRFTVGLNFFSSRQLRYILMFTDLIVLAVGVGLACSGNEFMAKRGKIDSPALGIPMWTMQISMVLGGVLVSVSSAVQFLDRFFDQQKKETAS